MSTDHVRELVERELALTTVGSCPTVLAKALARLADLPDAAFTVDGLANVITSLVEDALREARAEVRGVQQETEALMWARLLRTMPQRWH